MCVSEAKVNVTKQGIQDDIKQSQRVKDQKKLDVLRFLMAQINKQEIDLRAPLDEQQILSIIHKLIKQYKETLQLYQKAGREDLVSQQLFEIDLLMHYLPTPLTDAELDSLIAQTMDELGATSMQEMGKVIALMKTKLQGRGDMGLVSKKVKARLNQAG